MNTSRFNHLVRSLNEAFTRRGLLHGFAAMLGLAVVRFPGTVEAKKRHKKRKTCKHGKKKCGKQCIPKSSCCTDADCPAACFCETRKQGGDICIDAFDVDFACGDDADCPAGSVCLAIGVCSVPCPE